ncbi:MAG: glycosyltransferase family 39 protein [Patescibacteria group bacterium]
MLKIIKKSLESKVNQAIFFFACALFINSVLMFIFIARKSMLSFHPSEKILYLSFFIFSTLLIGSVIFFSKTFNLNEFLKKIYLAILPSFIALFAGIIISRNLDFIINIIVALYFISFGIYLILNRNFKWKSDSISQQKKEPKNKKILTIAIISIVMLLNLGFGIYHIEKFAAVDEPLWTFERIPDFWKNLGEKDWGGTLISDKPGITVALISGIGTIKENPKQYKLFNCQGKTCSPAQIQGIEKMNFALRSPLFFFTLFSLPLFYFFLKKIFNRKIALASLIFIGLCPILIGMSRIINPDAILWTFAPLSLLAYLAYIKKRNRNYLCASGIILGFALLTKYVANILFIFFFAMIFLEYIFNQENYAELKIKEYLKQSLIDFSILVFFSLSTFYVFCPMIWIKPQHLLNITIYSEAFRSTWKIFAAIIGSIIFDLIFFKGELYSKFSNFLSKNKKKVYFLLSLLFLLSIFFVFLNVYGQMRFIDFEEVFTSPKSSKSIGLINPQIPKIFFSNFYPIVFGIIPLAILSIIFSLIKGILGEDGEKYRSFKFYLLFFVFLYYLGSAVTGVSSTNRYQIIIFPIVLILAGIGLYEATKYFEKIKYFSISFYLFLILMCSYSLLSSFPFYSSYASSLLPLKYSVDLKDMGEGSYEAAIFLNSLPDAENLNIWTDKKGICYFFLGNCYTDLNTKSMAEVALDYAVISSGRESRTKKMITGDKKNNLFLPFYSPDKKPVWKVNIGERTNHFVKILKVEK